jgi:hypothetical protein
VNVDKYAYFIKMKCIKILIRYKWKGDFGSTSAAINEKNAHSN